MEELEIEIIKYEKPVIVEGEIELLREFAESIKESKDIETIISLLKRKEYKSRSGIYASVETDIKAFFELDQRDDSSWVLKPKFKERQRCEIKEFLIRRILAVKEGSIELPEQIFELKTFRIKLDNRFIDVEEITRKHWEYILYKSINYSDEYYVDIVFEGIAAFNKYFKLDKEEIEIVKKGDERKITEMIDAKRRKKNWPQQQV